MFALEQGRYTVAAGATGLIRACLDAQQEVRPGAAHLRGAHRQPPTGQGDDRPDGADYETSRLLWLRCGWLKNQGRRNNRQTSLAKWHATVASERAASDAVQIHGANGFSDEYPVGRYYRNCKGAVIYEGTREIHKLLQADYALGFRTDKPRRCDLPPVPGVLRAGESGAGHWKKDIHEKAKTYPRRATKKGKGPLRGWRKNQRGAPRVGKGEEDIHEGRKGRKELSTKGIHVGHEGIREETRTDRKDLSTKGHEGTRRKTKRMVPGRQPGVRLEPRSGGST